MWLRMPPHAPIGADTASRVQALHDEVAPQHTNFDFSRERDRTVLARIAIDFVPEEAASGNDQPNEARKLAMEKLRGPCPPSRRRVFVCCNVT